MRVSLNYTHQLCYIVFVFMRISPYIVNRNSLKLGFLAITICMENHICSWQFESQVMFLEVIVIFNFWWKCWYAPLVQFEREFLKTCSLWQFHRNIFEGVIALFNILKGNSLNSCCSSGLSTIINIIQHISLVQYRHHYQKVTCSWHDIAKNLLILH